MTVLPAHVTTHAPLALARVLQQYKGRPKLEGQVELHATQLQAVEDALWQLATEQYLDLAAGVQLDRLGAVLNESRGYMTDAEYTLALTAKIRMLRSSGTVADILAVFTLLLPDATLTLTQWFPAGLTLSVSDPVDVALVPVFASFLRRSRAAGVRGQLLYILSAATGIFAFSPDDTLHTSSTQGFADDAQTTGGHLAGAEEA